MSSSTTFPSPSNQLRILLLGAGGREHALSWKLAQSPRVAKVFVSPGNGGTDNSDGQGKVVNVSESDLPQGWGKEFEHLLKWASSNQVDLVIPGPEQPLVDGVEAVFRKGEGALRSLWSEFL